jgi:hypothetical protein
MGVQAVEVGLKAIKGEQVEKHIYILNSSQ